MTDFVVKILIELEQRINNEFDVFKNFYRETFGIDPKNLDNLLIKIKNEIHQVKQSVTRNEKENVNLTNNKNESLNADQIKSQTVKILKELEEKIRNNFHTFKRFNTNYGTGQINNENVDTILFKVKYQIDQMENNILLQGRSNDSDQFKTGDAAKANAMIRLQSLANLITCHILELDNNL